MALDLYTSLVLMSSFLLLDFVFIFLLLVLEASLK